MPAQRAPTRRAGRHHRRTIRQHNGAPGASTVTAGYTGLLSHDQIFDRIAEDITSDEVLGQAVAIQTRPPGFLPDDRQKAVLWLRRRMRVQRVTPGQTVLVRFRGNSQHGQSQVQWAQLAKSIVQCYLKSGTPLTDGSGKWRSHLEALGHLRRDRTNEYRHTSDQISLLVQPGITSAQEELLLSRLLQRQAELAAEVASMDAALSRGLPPGVGSVTVVD